MAGLGGVGLGRVIVVGNSFAGLLTARVLAEHADQVTVLDRDRVPETPGPRSGVPQGRHIHVFLAGGQQALEALLPGVLAELAERGVPAIDHPRDIVQLNRGQWVPRWHGGVAFLTGSRPLVEQVVRERVLAHPRIDLREAVEAVGLHGSARRVTGLVVRARGGDVPGEPEVLAADLVVDASGRSSRTPQWLTELGAPAPVEERIDTGLAYATRAYRAPDGPPVGDYRAIYFVPSPDQPRSAIVMPTEQPGQYLVTMTGLRGDEPPTDAEGFERFAGELPHPLVAQWLAAAQPDGPPMGHRGTANLRRRYDTLRGPDGLLVVGDAANAFNPLYGQGISVAAAGALALRRTLAKGIFSAQRLQRVVTEAGEAAWTISSGADKQMPGATGDAARSGVADRFARWYLGRVQDLAPGYSTVGFTFRDVIHLTAPATALFAPRVVATVLFGRIKPPLSEPPLTA